MEMGARVFWVGEDERLRLCVRVKEQRGTFDTKAQFHFRFFVFICYALNLSLKSVLIKMGVCKCQNFQNS